MMGLPMPLGKDDRSEPVFIVGAGRSGTTLLRLILNQHPELAIFGETQMFFRTEKYAPLSSAPSLERFLRDWRVICAHESPYPDLLERLNDTYRIETAGNYTELMTAIMRRFADLEGKRRWGEKTPAHVHRLGFLMRAYPKAKVIHIVRDPRAVVCSVLQKLDSGKVGWSNAYLLANYWRRCERAIDRAAARHPERVHRVSYEQLVNHPAEEIQKVCEFLGISFQPEMLNFSGNSERYVPSGDGEIQPHHAGLLRSINSDAVDQWRMHLSAEKLQLVEWGAGYRMAGRGYTAETAGLKVLPLILLPFVHAIWLLSEARRVAYRLALRLFWRVRIAVSG